MSMPAEPHDSIEVFYSYAHEDEKLRDELKKHLSSLKRQGVITDWYDRDITAGSEWDNEIKQHLESARVILLLISPDFMNSDYINDVEVKRAMERHEAGEARVIPVILRPVDWQGTPFSKLHALPTDAESVTSWEDKDEAFLDITKGIRKALLELSGPSANIPDVPDIPRPPKVGFVSRRDKDGHDIVERLREELAPQKRQLVALWGAGGVGKTTLAAEAVRALAETHEQRLIWISADGRPNFSLSTLLDDIGQQLGRTDLRNLAISAKEDALRPLIGAKPTLIVLDNLETITPEQEGLCKEFLAKRVACPALITTRERVADALLIPIAAMSAEEAREFFNRLIRQSPDSEIYDVINPERILKEAEHNPLIIEWVVAQIDLAQDPEEVLSDLAHGEGDAANRVFNRSYNLPQLNDGGRAVLLALALFTPTAGRPALAAVAGMDLGKKRDKDRFKRAQEVLASLWLVKKTDGGLRLAVAGLTRELTKAHLAMDPRAKTLPPRFVSRFVRFAQIHEQPTRENYDELEREKDNLLTAAQIAFSLGDHKSILILADDLAFPVSGILKVRGYWDDALRLAELALKVARLAQIKTAEAIWAHNVAMMYHDTGRLSEARPLYDECLEIRNALGNQRGVAITVHQLGMLAQDLGESDRAKQLYEESLAISKEIGDEVILSASLHQLGWLAQGRGDFAEAGRLYNESGEISTRLNDEDGITKSLHHLGMLAHEQDNFDEARRLYDESLRISKRIGNRSSIASSLHQLGVLLVDEEDYEQSRHLLSESLEILRTLGDRTNEAECLESLGKLELLEGNLVEAESLFIAALRLAETVGIQSRIGSVKYSLGLLSEKTGHKGQAVQLLNEAIGIFSKLHSHKVKSAQRDLDRIGGKFS